MIRLTEIQRKNRRKCFRTTLQIVICLGFVLGFAIRSYCQPIYDESNKINWKQTNGFSIISYQGVRTEETKMMISKSQLKKHFEMLKHEGYETISIEDVIKFYKEDAKLPDKAVLILFEDGNRDTYLNVQPLLEEYNFKATMMTYAYHLINSDSGPLKLNDLSLLENSTFWDIGSNGYRYSKINVMKQQNNNGEEVEKFKHYLLDYFRDQYGVPIETKEEMQKRINWDYEQVSKIYKKSLKENKMVYQMVHPDALFGNVNHAVEQVNLENIEEIFPMMINRDGSCYNSISTPMYNLTKMDVLPSWSADELLAQLNLWERSNFTYQETAAEWYAKEGEVKVEGEKLILIPNEYQRAFALLKATEQQKQNISFYVTENGTTTQTLYLRYNELQHTYIKISLKGNVLKIIERTADGIDHLLYETLISLEELVSYQNDLLYYKLDTTNPISPISWKFDLKLEGNQLNVVIGGKYEILEIDSSILTGGIAIESIGNLNSMFDELKIEIR